MSEGRHICAHCSTELSADALVCDACGMTRSLPAPLQGVLTHPALRPPPEPPAVTAPTLRPAPEPPPADASARARRNPLASGALPAAEKPPEILAGDPLGQPPPAKPPVVPFAAPAEPPPAKPPVVPLAATAEPPAAAPSAPPAPGEPETTPPAAEPHEAHPFD